MLIYVCFCCIKMYKKYIKIMAHKMKRTWYVVPEANLNTIISEAFPNAAEQRGLQLGPQCNTSNLDFAYELETVQVQMLCKNCIDSGICSLMKFNSLVYVRCGENPIRPATKQEWNPEYIRIKKTQKRILKRLRVTKNKINSRGFFPNLIR